jgi:hypothetical protein
MPCAAVARHAPVTYRTYRSANHERVVQAAQAGLVAWIEERFVGGRNDG